MNTVRSTWFGWGTLIVAGGGAYYFAKRSINADRQARHEVEMRKRERVEALAYGRSPSKKQISTSKPLGSMVQEDMNGYASEDHAGSPSSEASHDPAPTRHVPETGEQRIREKSKYEATEPWKSKKGDRFS